MSDLQTLRVYVNERDEWRGRPLYETLVEKFRDKGAAGATVCRAMRGFGQSGVLHPQGRFGLSRDLPMIITVVDTSEGIARLLPLIDDMVASGIVVITNVEDANVNGVSGIASTNRAPRSKGFLTADDREHRPSSCG